MKEFKLTPTPLELEQVQEAEEKIIGELIKSLKKRGYTLKIEKLRKQLCFSAYDEAGVVRWSFTKSQSGIHQRSIELLKEDEALIASDLLVTELEKDPFLLSNLKAWLDSEEAEGLTKN